MLVDVLISGDEKKVTCLTIIGKLFFAIHFSSTRNQDYRETEEKGRSDLKMYVSGCTCIWKCNEGDGTENQTWSNFPFLV